MKTHRKRDIRNSMLDRHLVPPAPLLRLEHLVENLDRLVPYELVVPLPAPTHQPLYIQNAETCVPR